MQLIGYCAPQVDVNAVPGLGGLLKWTETTVRQTARRAVALASLIDRVGSTLDDVAALRRAAEVIAGSMSELGANIAGIDHNAGKIAEEIAGLSVAAQGIDTHAEKLATGIDELDGHPAHLAATHRDRRSAGQHRRPARPLRRSHSRGGPPPKSHARQRVNRRAVTANGKVPFTP